MKLIKLSILTLILLDIAAFSAPALTKSAQSVKPDSLELPIPDSLIIPKLDFRSADIRDVFRTIATKYKLNIWMSPDVKGVVPVHLNNIKVKDAIKFIVSHYGYNYVYRNGVIEVYKPKVVKVEPPKPPIKIDLKGDKITFDLKDAPMDTVVRKYTKLTGINVILDKGVKGTIKGYLDNVEIRKGLRLLFESNGYEVKESNDIFTITNIKIGNGQKGPGGLPVRGGRFSLRIVDNRVFFEINNGELKQVINEIANQSGINIFIYGDIKGRISARVDSINIEAALQYLLRNTKYTFWKSGQIFFIGDESMKKMTNSEFIALKYLKAEEAVELLPKAILEKAAIKVVKGQNGLMVIGTYDVISASREYLRLVDKPIAQILIEALVVDFSTSRMNEIGFKAFMQSPSDSSLLTDSYFPAIKADATGTSLSRGLNGIMDYFSINQIVKLPSNFRAQIGLMENMGVANIQSTPQIATLNGHTAEIRIGTREYLLLTSEYEAGENVVRQKTTERIESFEANISLSVTPWVTASREVTAEVKPVFQIPGVSPQPGKIPPPINTREITSTVRLKDGETYVLGGLITSDVQDSRESLPLLGRIPILGWFFSYKTKKVVKSKMMIFLTPHIYYGSEGAVDKEELISSWK